MAGTGTTLATKPGNSSHVFGLDNWESSCPLNITDRLLIQGFNSKSGVRNFLNVPYATIPARFRSARLLLLDELEGTIDAQYYGPRCPQGPDELHKIMAHMVERLGMDQCESEYDCLHVNIYSPALAEASSKTPVYVYIHGGALAFGDNTTEFDGNHLVKRSVDIGKPIIVVTLNYRVGVLGFLTSQELQKEAASNEERHVKNQGLNDQRIALQWVQKYIHLFGGDKDQVTLAGESAGSMSVWAHVKGQQQGLFRRAMMLSGPPFGLQKPEDVQSKFNKLASRYCPEDSPWQQTLAALRSVPVQELVMSWEGAISNFIADPEWFDMNEEQVTRLPNGTHEELYDYFSNLPEWLDSALIMNARDECALFGVRCWRDIDLSTARSKLRQAYDSQELCDILEQSPLFSQARSPFNALTNISSDAMFIRGSVRLATLAAKRTTKPIYFGILDAKDPLPFELRGFAWHCMLPSILFYLPPSQNDPALRRTADVVTEKMLSYMSGLQPWPGLNEAWQALSIDGETTCMSSFDRSDLLKFPNTELEEQFLKQKLSLVGLALREQ